MLTISPINDVYKVINSLKIEGMRLMILRDWIPELSDFNNSHVNTKSSVVLLELINKDEVYEGGNIVALGLELTISIYTTSRASGFKIESLIREVLHPYGFLKLEGVQRKDINNDGKGSGLELVVCRLTNPYYNGVKYKFSDVDEELV